MAKRKRYTRWTEERRTRFLEALAATGHVAHACKLSGMSSAAAYVLRNRDESFRHAWAGALEQSLDELFGILMRRARDGTITTIQVDGKPIKTIHQFSDRLAMQLLARYRPELHSKVVAERILRPKPAEQVRVFDAMSRIIHGGEAARE